jgi:hypothetical protein
MDNLIENIVTEFTKKVEVYKQIFKTFEEVSAERTEIKRKLTEVQEQKSADNQECNLSNKGNVDDLINNFFTITDTDRQGNTATITLTPDLFDKKINEEFKTGYTSEDEDGNPTTVLGVQEKIHLLFSGDDRDLEVDIPGLNITTPDRPIDSPRYTTFQGV